MSAVRSMPEPERILVRGPNWLGDVVMLTPALRALRVGFPNAKIVAQLPEPLIPLLEGLSFCDEHWPLRSRGGGPTGWQEDVRRIASERFDLGLVVPESVSSALLMRFGRVRRIVGFSRDPLRRALLNERLEAPGAWGRRRLVSKERYAMQLVASVGVIAGSLRTELAVRAEDASGLALALSSTGVETGQFMRERPVVIAPGASFGGSKCWPAESFAELADRLGALGRRVVLLGAPGEHERVLAVQRAMQSTAVVLDGVLDVGGLKALLAGAGALVANDAGARHVAAAFGVPSVIFFGPTSVAKTADNLAAIEALETEHACRPCYLRECPIDHRCLRSIGVDEAESAIGRVLGGRIADAAALCDEAASGNAR